MSQIPSSTFSSSPSDPPTPIYADGLEWITAYLTIHSLSVPSRRYAFLLWLAVVLIFLGFAIFHWTDSKGGYFGAVWSKWSMRRRTPRKKHALAVANRSNKQHRQPRSLPPNAQLLCLTVLTLASLALAFVGPDYLSPNLKVWQLAARSPPRQLYDTSTFEPYAPQYTISKSLWSSAARTGQIAFALFPLCVLFALKAPPFAIFAIPFMIQLYFDKLAWLHRWSGRLIWFFTTIHVVLWSIQLSQDVNPSTGRIAYVYAWTYTRFIYGWIAFALLTLIILLSLYPIRRRYYESFYALHVLLVPLMLVLAALHHPTIWWWCWAALGVWAGERLWRVTWWIYGNGIVGGAVSKAQPLPSPVKTPSGDTWEMDHIHHPSVDSNFSNLAMNGRPSSPLSAYYDKSPISTGGATAKSAVRPSSYQFPVQPNHSNVTFSYLPSPYIPPRGYVHAELLSGRTVRLRLVTPAFLPWSPGQHFLVNIPTVSRLTSHPFTCASVCDEEAPTDAGRVMLFLVRAKIGWTQDLWDTVSRMTAEQSRGDAPPTFQLNSLPKRGVLLRAFVDGPFGSSKRARWGNYSTGIIVTGGSGVSFGLSLLQYMCMCLAGRDGRHLGSRPGGWGRNGADLKRVRFIWLIREYSHVQWCASLIRSCTAMVAPSALQIDIYVTNFKPLPMKHPVLPPPRNAYFGSNPMNTAEELQPPVPKFAREHSEHLRSKSSESVESHESSESDVDLSYYLGEYFDEEELPPDEMGVAHETNIIDLTNFDGDVDTALPGEAYLSRRLKKEGKIRRLQSRKLKTRSGRMDQDARAPHPLAYSQAQTPPNTSSHPYDTRHTYSDPFNTPSSSSRVSRSKKKLTLSVQSTDRLLPISPLSERPQSGLSQTDMYSPFSPYAHHSDTSLHSKSTLKAAPLSADFQSSVSLVTPSVRDGSGPSTYPSTSYPDSKPGPGRPRVPTLQTSSPSTMNVHLHEMPSAATSASTLGPSDVHFEMDDQEAIDVNIVSEHARPGKPKLDKVIADEVEASNGAVVVACCGPTSLNAMVRKIVAAQIDPARIRRGDMRGSITLVSEEFEY